MPSTPYRVCRHAGCSALTRDGYCVRHRPVDTRPSARKRGYDAAWERTRTVVLGQQPLCPCGRPATEVHHRQALRDGGTHARGNLVALCRSCHVKLTRQAAKR
jgi:5-methylcytosine-specific restriction protein A